MGRRCSECDTALLADVWTQVPAPPCRRAASVHGRTVTLPLCPGPGPVAPGPQLSLSARAQFSKGAVHKCLNCKRKGGFRKAINLSRERREEASHTR